MVTYPNHYLPFLNYVVLHPEGSCWLFSLAWLWLSRIATSSIYIDIHRNGKTSSLQDPLWEETAFVTQRSTWSVWQIIRVYGYQAATYIQPPLVNPANRLLQPCPKSGPQANFRWPPGKFQKAHSCGCRIPLHCCSAANTRFSWY